MIHHKALSIIVVILGFTIPNILRAAHGVAGAPAGGAGGGAGPILEVANAADCCDEAAHDPLYTPIKEHFEALVNVIAFSAPGVAATVNEVAYEFAQCFKDEALFAGAEPFDHFTHFCKIPREELVFVAMYHARATVPRGGAEEAARIEALDPIDPAAAQKISPMLAAAHALNVDLFEPLFTAYQHTELKHHIGHLADTLPVGALEIGHPINTWATHVMNNFRRIYQMLLNHLMREYIVDPVTAVSTLDIPQAVLDYYCALTEHEATLAEAGTSPYYKHIIIKAFLHSIAAMMAAKKATALPELERAWADRVNHP